ncbi:transposase [Streptomyces sp. MC1]|nr:transposase [Streptomyces sp. MC1]
MITAAVINGMLYRVRTGVQWRDPPERFGPEKGATLGALTGTRVRMFEKNPF